MNLSRAQEPIASATVRTRAPKGPQCVGVALYFWIFAALFLWSASVARAQEVHNFEAHVDQSHVTAGDSISYYLVLEFEGGRGQNVAPTAPDFGGLRVDRGPMQQTNTMSINGDTRITVTWEWQLSAPAVGRYTIGASALTASGHSYQTTPIVVEVAAQQPIAGLPSDATSQITSARAGDPDVTRQLRDKLFLRATISNPNPYVGEPVIVTYTLYNDNLPGLRFGQPTAGDIQGAVHEELFNALHSQSLDEQPMTLGNHTYQGALLYRIAVMPNKAGDLTLGPFSLTGVIQTQGRRGLGIGPGMNPFLGDPFFGGGIQFEIPPPPVHLNVRPLPLAGQSHGFNGTVGDFKLSAKADRDHMGEDDLLTLDLALSGHGAIELATPPDMPDSPDFERAEQTQSVQKQNTADSIGGTKHFQWILRPKHAGTLTLPAVQYPVFNPYDSQYRVLQTTPVKIAVTASILGQARRAQQAATAADAAAHPVGSAASASVYDLNYLKSIGQLRSFRPAPPLFQSPAFWLAQVAGLVLLVLALRRDRRRAALDPAEQRRLTGWRHFEKRLRALQQRAQLEGTTDVAAVSELEQAVRALIADRFNVSAEGLTRQEIERLLFACAMPTEHVRRICDLLEECAAVRYAPTGMAGGNLHQWISEFSPLLREGLYQ